MIKNNLKSTNTHQFGDNVSAGDGPLYAHFIGLVWPECRLVPRMAPFYAVAFVVHVDIQVGVFV